jgi:hypothetical protein
MLITIIDEVFDEGRMTWDVPSDRRIGDILAAMARKAGWQLAGPASVISDPVQIANEVHLYNPENRRRVRSDRTLEEEGIGDAAILLLRRSVNQPTAASPALAEPQASPVPAMGPIGKVRNPFLSVVLFPIITLGIYSLVWFCALWSEARRYAHGRNGIKIGAGGGALFLYILLPGIIAIAGGIVGVASGSPGIAILGVLTAAVLVLVGLTKTAGLPRKMRIAKAVPPNKAGHPGALVFICLIPIVGILIFWLAVQVSMNDFWRKEAQTT